MTATRTRWMRCCAPCPTCQEQGYVFVTVAELLALRGVTPEPGVTYRRAPPQEAEGG